MLNSEYLNEIICNIENFKKREKDIKDIVFFRFFLMEQQLEVLRVRRILTQKNIQIKGFLRQLKTISQKIDKFLHVNKTKRKRK